MIPYPHIDPVFFRLGPIQLRWYGLAYILGLLGAVWLFKKDLKKRASLSGDQVINLISFIMVGVLIGGRLGYILVYDLSFYIQNPSELLAFWHGGMAYHGAALGSVVALVAFSLIYHVNLWVLLDFLGIGSTIGLCLGRMANFINGELYGRLTDVPWAMVFPNGGPLARHPSQLYEAFFEGIVLFIILFILLKKMSLKNGQLFSIYLCLYGLFRYSLEFFREPDPQIGLLWNVISMGQLLSLIMVAAGLVLFVCLRKKVN